MTHALIKQHGKKLAIVLAIVIVFALFSVFFKDYFSLTYIQSQLEKFKGFYADNPVFVPLGYFFLYIFVTALSLPGAAVMTLLAGALFGLSIGMLIVSFASSIGATCAFLVARYLLGDSIQRTYADKLAVINANIEKDGAFYLFTLRLIPAFPFFVINLVMGLTRIRMLTFYLVSQIGMFAGTLVYVNAGKELAKIESAGDILSTELILAFIALGLLPWIAKFIVFAIRKIRGK